MCMFTEYECNRILNTSKCLKTRARGDCPSYFGLQDEVVKGCKGRMWTPGGSLTKPFCSKLYSKKPSSEELNPTISVLADSVKTT